jgi:hypothetical protein
MLAVSFSRRIDGIWVGAYRRPEHLILVEAALLLIKEHGPLFYSRVTRNLERIWVFLIPDGLAHYDDALNACVLDERFVVGSEASIVASVIVHEATHARIEQNGIRYDEDKRTRIEGICARQELAFAARLPNSAKLQNELAGDLDWYPSNSDYFANGRVLERHANGIVAMLRHVGAPGWLIRILTKLKPINPR